MSADHGKQFTLYCSNGPNPWKVALILEELDLEYHILLHETVSLIQKQPAFTALNPNGRFPVLIDHSNNDFVIWESGAIILYLVGKYDKMHKISFADFDSTAIANQYLMFQMSGQGPYFGQLGWFTIYHSEKIPSAINRYVDEIKRVLGVLEGILEDKDYLVGDKASYADLSFVAWNALIMLFPVLATWKASYPKVAEWHDRLEAREGFKRLTAAKEAAIAKGKASA